MDDSKDNYLRRERIRKKHLMKEVEEMRAALAVYTLEEIRNYRLPYYQALLIRLEEMGYFSTSEYIRQLFKLQKSMMLTDERAATCSQLISSNKELKILSDALMKAEVYHSENNYRKECEEFLRMAVYFAFLNYDWWWLGEELLLKSIDTYHDYPGIGKEYEALSRYSYAKFLIANTKQYEAAVVHLDKVRVLSNGQQWTTRRIFPNETGTTLNMLTSSLLYMCYIQDAKIAFNVNSNKSENLAMLAGKRAADACDRLGESEALLIKGLCELKTGRPNAAILSFRKALSLQVKVNCHKGICEVKLQLAMAYLVANHVDASLKTLLEVKRDAEHFQLPFYLGHAFWKLGIFYLNSGEAHTATPLLAQALKIFQKRGNQAESHQVMTLQSVSAGIELFPLFVELLTRTTPDNSDNEENLKALCDWKDSRKIFWLAKKEYFVSVGDLINTTLSDLMFALSNKRTSSLVIEEEPDIVETYTAPTVALTKTSVLDVLSAKGAGAGEDEKELLRAVASSKSLTEADANENSIQILVTLLPFHDDTVKEKELERTDTASSAKNMHEKVIRLR